MEKCSEKQIYSVWSPRMADNIREGKKGDCEALSAQSRLDVVRKWRQMLKYCLGEEVDHLGFRSQEKLPRPTTKEYRANVLKLQGYFLQPPFCY